MASEGSLDSSPSSLLASTDSERSSQPEEDIRRETDDEDVEKKLGVGTPRGKRRRHWELYKSMNKSLLLDDYYPGDEKPGSVKMTIEDLQRNLSEWKKHHAHLIDQFRKLKSSEGNNSSRLTRTRSAVATSGRNGTDDIPDTDHGDLLRQDSLVDKDREIALLKKQLGLKEERIGRLISDNEGLEDSYDNLKMHLAECRHSVERLERERNELVGEVDRLRGELNEERLARSKEKAALDKNTTQLQRKVQESLIKLEGEVRMVQQYKADLDSYSLLLTTSQEEVKQLRGELATKRTGLSHMLGTIRSATTQISSLSKKDSRPARSTRKTGHQNERSEYEAATEELEAELQTLIKSWEAMRASLIKNSSEITGLTEAKKKLEEDLHKKIEENWRLEARLKEVREISSRAESNQSRLQVAVTDYESQVHSLRQERDKAKLECQKMRLENDKFRRDLESGNARKEEMEKLQQEKVERLESLLSKEREDRMTMKTSLGEEKRLVETQLKEERRRVKALESRLSNDNRQKEELQAKLEKTENDSWERQQRKERQVREESAELIQLRQKVAELMGENESLNRRNRDLQKEHKILTDHLNEVTNGDIKKLSKLETLIRQVRHERDDLESKNFELSHSSSPSLSNLDQISHISVNRERNIRHLHSSPFLGSSSSLNSHLLSSHIESRATPSMMSRQDHLLNSTEFMPTGLRGHSPSSHSGSQEVSSTESEKDSNSQLPIASRHSIELEDSSPSHHLPNHRQSPRPLNSSASTSEND